MDIFTRTLLVLGNFSFLGCMLFLILFIWAYSPTVARRPSPLGATILGGKAALLMICIGTVLRVVIHDSLFVDIFRFVAIASTFIWLVYDYVIMRRLQNSDKHVSRWRRWLPFDNYKKQ